MAALAWLLIPLVAAVAAAIWGRWAASRRTTGDGASLAGYERFREAMRNPGADADDPDAAGAGADDAESDVSPEGEEGSPRGPVAGQVP